MIDNDDLKQKFNRQNQFPNSQRKSKKNSTQTQSKEIQLEQGKFNTKDRISIQSFHGHYMKLYQSLSHIHRITRLITGQKNVQKIIFKIETNTCEQNRKQQMALVQNLPKATSLNKKHRIRSKPEGQYPKRI